MSISSKTLYESCHVLPQGQGFKPVDESKDTIIESYLYDVLSHKRKACEIDRLKSKLKEKSLVLEKALSMNKKKKRSRKRFGISHRQMKLHGIHSVPREGQKYNLFLPLNDLWKKYMENTFSPGKEDFVLKADERLLKIDYHGAELNVYACTCKQMVGIEGIIVKETKNMFMLITRYNELKSIPKKGTVFTFEMNGYKVKLNGDCLVGRPGVRMTKKVKPVFHADLLIS